MSIRNIIIFGCFIVVHHSVYAGVPNPDNTYLEYDYSPSVSRDDNPLPTL